MAHNLVIAGQKREARLQAGARQSIENSEGLFRF
jgi:hypothetical protein